MSWLTVLIILAALIIAGLAFYAGRLLYLLRQQRQRQAEAIAARNTKLLDSIHIIARAMLEEQCDFSEGAIRICNLLDHLHPHQPYQQTFPTLFTLFERVKDMPTHEARQALSKTERRQQDRQRQGWEQELAGGIRQEAEVLKDLRH